MSIRITTGLFKGMNIATPADEKTRPTTARVRQAVMNTLAPYFPDAFVLDLFAGSGAVGLEAVSRGAKGCVFVENHPPALTALRTNIQEALRRVEKNQVFASLEVLPVSVGKAAERVASLGTFNIIWADPPYSAAGDWARQIRDDWNDVAAPEAILAFESDENGKKDLLNVMSQRGSWELWKEKSYGDTCVTMFLRTSDEG